MMRACNTLLSLPSFPDAVPESVLESACTLAQLLGARLTVHLAQLNGDRASWPPMMGAFPLDFPQLMNDLVVKSEANAGTTARSLEKITVDFGVKLDLRRFLVTPYPSQAPLVDLARLHDLIMLPVPESDAFDRPCVQAVLFGSGRPVVLLPSRHRRLRQLDRIVVAWDFSREAARALADALPLMERAREVRVVTVAGEKHLQTSATRADLEKFLGGHGLHFSLNQIALEGGHIGRFLMDYATNVGADMLVMGAYGHSRLREFTLGGATREVLREPLLPVLLSH
jgi:nucleotide-binding universal stress UspA family protein